MVDRQICVVLDSSTWIGARMLRTPLGAALLYSLRQMKGSLGLPEVAELEVQENLPRVGMEAVDSIRKNFQTIGALTGEVSNYVVPKHEQLRAAVRSRFGEFETYLKRVPVALTHAKAALSRVIAGMPPSSSKNEQFRDSLIWEAILELAVVHSVHFITNDKGFFRDRDPKKGLASELLQECQSRDLDLKVYYGVQHCLENLRKSVPPLDLQRIIGLIEPEIRKEALKAAERENFTVAELKDSHIEPFLTEKDGTLAISFKLAYQIVDITTGPYEERVTGSLEASGSGFFNQNSLTVFDVRLEAIDLMFEDKEGRPRNPRICFGYAEFSLERPATVTYTIRHPLIGPDD